MCVLAGGAAGSDGSPKAEGGSASNGDQQRGAKRKWFDRDSAINAQRRGLRSSLSTLQNQVSSASRDLTASLESLARLTSSQQKMFVGEVIYGTLPCNSILQQNYDTEIPDLIDTHFL